MIGFAAAVARLDAEADTRLGDFLFYDVAGIRSDTAVSGFVIDPAELTLEATDAPLDQVGQRRRLKINRLLVTQPSKEDRVRSEHALLADFIWAPTAWRKITNGRYWLIDLEKKGRDQ